MADKSHGQIVGWLKGDIGVMISSHFLAELGEFLGASPHMRWGHHGVNETA